MLLQPTYSWTWRDFVRRSVLVPGFREGNSITENLLLANQIASDSGYGVAVRGHWPGTTEIVLFLLVGQPLVTEKLDKYDLDWYLSLDRGDCIRISKGGGETVCEVTDSGVTIPALGTFVFDVVYSRPSNTQCYGHSKEPEFFNDKDHLCSNVECFPKILDIFKVAPSKLSPPVRSAAENPAQRIGSIRGYVVMVGRDRADVPVVVASVVIERSGQVKFLVGLDKDDRLVVVFDSRLDLHDDLAKLHELRPLGGGWLEIDLEGKQVKLGGSSLGFGKEIDRQLTLSMMQRALPDYLCELA